MIICYAFPSNACMYCLKYFMMNNETIFRWYLSLFDSLNDEFKLKLITQLLDRFQKNYKIASGNETNPVQNSKQEQAKTLFGAWKDDDIDGDEIISLRTISEQQYDL